MKITILLFSIALMPAWGFDFTVIHTNDLHSYVGGIGPDALYTPDLDHDPVKGHLARMSTKIAELKADLGEQPHLLVDAGDFYGGTLFQTLGPQTNNPYSPEMEFFIYNKFHISTLGNHEFDTYEAGLANILKKVDGKSPELKIVISNLQWKNPANPLKQFYQSYDEGHSRRLVDIFIKDLTYQGKALKVGFLGILGPDASDASTDNRKQTSFIGFNDDKVSSDFDSLYKLMQAKVDLLKSKYKVDVVILTTHSGTPEDEQFAKNVKGLDLIIAGHTHELYQRPKQIGDTLISQAGCYGNYLGVLKLSFQSGKLQLQDPSLPTYVLIDDSIPSDLNYLALVDKYIEEINRHMPMPYNTPIFKANKSIQRVFKETHNPVGRLVTSAVKEQYNLEVGGENKIDFYFTSLELIRQDVVSVGADTPYQFSDTFKFAPIGVDAQGQSGYPVVTFYLSKFEVKMLITFMELYKHLSPSYTPIFSEDITYEMGMLGLPSDLKRGVPYAEWPEYLHVGTAEIVAEHVDDVKAISYGLLNFNPKDAKGQEIAHGHNSKLKEYYLFSKFMKSKAVFPFSI